MSVLSEVCQYSVYSISTQCNVSSDGDLKKRLNAFMEAKARSSSPNSTFNYSTPSPAKPANAVSAPSSTTSGSRPLYQPRSGIVQLFPRFSFFRYSSVVPRFSLFRYSSVVPRFNFRYSAVPRFSLFRYSSVVPRFSFRYSSVVSRFKFRYSLDFRCL